jgi:hypothetical protein
MTNIEQHALCLCGDIAALIAVVVRTSAKIRIAQRPAITLAASFAAAIPVADAPMIVPK